MKIRTRLLVIISVLLTVPIVFLVCIFLQHRAVSPSTKTSKIADESTHNTDVEKQPATGIAIDERRKVRADRLKLEDNYRVGEKAIHIHNQLRSLVDTSQSLEVRLGIVKSAPPTLTSTEIHALVTYLKNDGPREGVSGGQEHYLQHVVMEKLSDSPRMPLALDGLIEVARDESLDPVTRDYALQHLGTWAEDGSDRERIETELWGSLNERGATFAGTALLALRRVLRNTTEEDSKEALRKECLRIAETPEYSTASRITAIHLCGELHIRQALALSRDLAQDDPRITLRLTAITALGDIGTESDLSLLHAMLRSTAERLLHPAIERAARNIHERVILAQ